MNTPTATITNEITLEQISAGIEHYKQVIAEWDADIEDNEPVATEADVIAAQERVAKMFAEINAMTKVTTEQALKPVKTPTVRNVSEDWLLGHRTSAFNGRGSEPAAQKAAAPATQAKPAIYTCMFLPGEHRPFIHMTAEVDMPEYALEAEQAYYLVYSESLSECAEQPVYHIVTWSYEQCRWLCPCPAHIHQCKHIRTVNQDCKARKAATQQPVTEMPIAA